MDKSHDQKAADIKADITAWANGSELSGKGQTAKHSDAMKITPEEIKDWANTHKTNKK